MLERSEASQGGGVETIPAEAGIQRLFLFVFASPDEIGAWQSLRYNETIPTEVGIQKN